MVIQINSHLTYLYYYSHPPNSDHATSTYLKVDTEMIFKQWQLCFLDYLLIVMW